MNTHPSIALCLLLSAAFPAWATHESPAPPPKAVESKPAAQPAPEMTPTLRNEIDCLLALRASLAIRDIASSLGASFTREPFLAAYRTAILAGKECTAPDKTDCPLAYHMANEIYARFDHGDYQPQRLLDELEQRLKSDTFSDEEAHEELQQLQRRIWKQYRPILLGREATKEKNLLLMNAARPEVTTLPCGIQYETEPGSDTIRQINRCTRETGIAFYTRTTSETSFDRLPESVRNIADQLPAASSWTFYVPYEAEKAAADARRQAAEDLDARRIERLKELLPGRVEDYKPAKPAPRHDARERTPLLRIKVWKDDPQSPVQVKPDISGRDL